MPPMVEYRCGNPIDADRGHIPSCGYKDQRPFEGSRNCPECGAPMVFVRVDFSEIARILGLRDATKTP